MEGTIAITSGSGRQFIFKSLDALSFLLVIVLGWMISFSMPNVDLTSGNGSDPKNDQYGIKATTRFGYFLENQRCSKMTNIKTTVK
jgi:hypothetical protein